MKMTTTELRARVNQMFKEQVVPEFAHEDLVYRYNGLMGDIDFIETHDDVRDDADEVVLAEAQDFIDQLYKGFLNPETAKVGEGATVCLYSDSHAYTIIGKSKTGKKLTLRQCKATLDPSFKPTFIMGGFLGHCTNQDEQTYSYEEDPEGEIITANWSDAKKGYYHHGLHIVRGRHEFYDYNF